MCDILSQQSFAVVGIGRLFVVDARNEPTVNGYDSCRKCRGIQNHVCVYTSGKEKLGKFSRNLTLSVFFCSVLDFCNTNANPATFTVCGGEFARRVKEPTPEKKYSTCTHILGGIRWGENDRQGVSFNFACTAN